MRRSRRSFAFSAGTLLLFASVTVTEAASSIDESLFIPVGGIEQWIAIQGQDRNNPVILYLHGGPGEAQSPFLSQFAPWERDFTVVNWDQRGSGRTYGKNGPKTAGMTINRMAKDTVDVTEYVLRRLHKRKLILVGQSWGAILGLTVIQRRPDLYYAFVGTGQPVNATLAIENQERWARKQAEAEKDYAAVKRLDSVQNLPPTDPKRVMASRKWMMSSSDRRYLQTQKKFMGPPPYPTKGPVASWIAGYRFTARKLYNEVTALDARKSAMNLPIPFFVIEGRDDHVTPFAAAKAYLRDVHAPKKAFIAIDGGHYACFTSSRQFLTALRKYVLPLVR